jgi:hypothetical protein
MDDLEAFFNFGAASDPPSLNAPPDISTPVNIPYAHEIGGADRADDTTFKTFIEQKVLEVRRAYAECGRRGNISEIIANLPSEKDGWPIPVLYIKKGYPNREQASNYFRMRPGMVVIDFSTTPSESIGYFESAKGNKVDLGGGESGTKKAFKGSDAEWRVKKKGGSYPIDPGSTHKLKMWRLDFEKVVDPSKGESAQEGDATCGFCLCYWVEIPVKADDEKKSGINEVTAEVSSSTQTVAASNTTASNQDREAFANEWAPKLKQCLVCAGCSTLHRTCMQHWYFHRGP